MPKIRYDFVEDVATAITHDFFVTMLNPKYRGPKFDFVAFDIENHIVAMMGTSFRTAPSDKENDYARTVARRVWNHLLERSAVASWIRSQSR